MLYGGLAEVTVDDYWTQDFLKSSNGKIFGYNKPVKATFSWYFYDEKDLK